MVKYGLIILLVCFSNVVFGGIPIDSIGLEKKDNRWFIKHEVVKGETFYRLSQEYDIEIDDIIHANSDISVLSVGQIILVPYSDLPYFIHRIQQGETIYSISKKYRIESQDLKDWNNLADNSIHLGDRLKINQVGLTTSGTSEVDWSVHVVESGESLYGIANQHSLEVDSIKAWNYLTSNDIQEGMYLRYQQSDHTADVAETVAVIAATTKDEVDQEEPEELEDQEEQEDPVDVDSFQTNNAIVESPLEVYPLPLYEERGMAALIEGSEGNGKFLALHRTAEPGTIMVVRNELNNQVVFVRVIGQLPDTGANEKLIVKVSEAAWKNMHAVNNRFRVRVSYFK